MPTKLSTWKSSLKGLSLTSLRVLFVAAVTVGTILGVGSSPARGADATDLCVMFPNGSINGNVTLPGNTVYYFTTCGLTVNQDATLTIEAGAILKGYHSTYSNYRLDVMGVINVLGTAQNPVVFTSYLDDVYGGDTNGDGYSSHASNSDWGGIGISNRYLASHMQYAVVRYGNNAIRVSRTAVSMDHMLVERNMVGAVITHSGSDPAVSIQYSTFRQNADIGIKVVP